MRTTGALLTFLILFTTSARAEVLSWWNADLFIGAQTPNVTEMGLSFGAGSSVLTPDGELFEGLVFTEADVGSTFEANAESDPDFATILALLTDGKPGFVQFCRELPVSSGCSVGSTEAQAFRLSPDFAGMTVDRITMTIEFLEFKTPGYKGATDITASVTFNVEGTSVGTSRSAWSTVKTRY